MSTDAGAAHDIGTVDSRLDGGLWRIVLTGQWTVAAATGIDRALKSLPSASTGRLSRCHRQPRTE